jgi:hypothetical protein
MDSDTALYVMTAPQVTPYGPCLILPLTLPVLRKLPFEFGTSSMFRKLPTVSSFVRNDAIDGWYIFFVSQCSQGRSRSSQSSKPLGFPDIMLARFTAALESL